MAMSAELKALLDSIAAMSLGVAKDIDIPLRPFLQIAGRICEAGQRDSLKLQTCKYDILKLPSIALHIKALTELSAIYSDVQFDQPDTQKAFVKLREEAEAICFELLTAMDYAFSSDENLMGKTSKIREGNSIADLIQDLVDAKVTCVNNISLLQAINFDETLLEKAETVSSQLADLLAKATLDRSDSPEQRIERDKVFTILKGMLKELSYAGYYTFRNDPAHAERYSLVYTPRKRRTKKVTDAVTVAG